MQRGKTRLRCTLGCNTAGGWGVMGDAVYSSGEHARQRSSAGSHRWVRLPWETPWLYRRRCLDPGHAAGTTWAAYRPSGAITIYVDIGVVLTHETGQR